MTDVIFSAVLCDAFGGLSKRTVELINYIIYSTQDTAQGSIKSPRQLKIGLSRHYMQLRKQTDKS